MKLASNLVSGFLLFSGSAFAQGSLPHGLLPVGPGFGIDKTIFTKTGELSKGCNPARIVNVDYIGKTVLVQTVLLQKDGSNCPRGYESSAVLELITAEEKPAGCFVSRNVEAQSKDGDYEIEMSLWFAKPWTRCQDQNDPIVLKEKSDGKVLYFRAVKTK